MAAMTPCHEALRCQMLQVQSRDVRRLPVKAVLCELRVFAHYRMYSASAAHLGVGLADVLGLEAVVRSGQRLDAVHLNVCHIAVRRVSVQSLSPLRPHLNSTQDLHNTQARPVSPAREGQRTVFQLVIAALGPLLRSTRASIASVDGGDCRMQNACRTGTVPSLANAIRSAFGGSCAKRTLRSNAVCWSWWWGPHPGLLATAFDRSRSCIAV